MWAGGLEMGRHEICAVKFNYNFTNQNRNVIFFFLFFFFFFDKNEVKNRISEINMNIIYLQIKRENSTLSFASANLS